MKWIFYNPNSYGNNIGDCVIRALTLAFGKTWDDVYSMLAEFGFKNKLMPSSNENWPALLRKSGFTRYIIPNECPDCYTVRDFCEDHPQGMTDPNEILQHLLTTGQVSQDQVNKIIQMQNFMR